MSENELNRTNNKPLQEIIDNERKLYDKILLPVQIDDYIQKGIQKGRRAKKSNWNRRIGLIAASFLLFCLVFSVRVSPAFAAYVSQIPGLQYLVKLINYDKGLVSAIENEFIQVIGISDSKEDIKFTVDGIIIDQSSMIMFYTLESKKNLSNIQVERFEFLNEKGEGLRAGFGYEYFPDKEKHVNKKQSKVTVTFNDKESIIPDTMTVRLKLREIPSNMDEPAKPIKVGDELPEPKGLVLDNVWEVSFTIDKKSFEDLNETILVNRTFDIEGQKFTFEKLVIYPTRIALYVQYDPKNTKEIFGFEDLILLNEKGEQWGRIMNGVTGSKVEEFRDILYFQSNYFSKPKELYLKGNAIRALDKSMTEVILDLNKRELLKAPPGLSLENIGLEGSSLKINFKVQTDPRYDENRGLSVFSWQFRDSEGKVFNYGAQSNSNPHGEDFFQQITLVISGQENIKSPIFFRLDDYPIRLIGDFTVKLK